MGATQGRWRDKQGLTGSNKRAAWTENDDQRKQKEMRNGRCLRRESRKEQDNMVMFRSFDSIIVMRTYFTILKLVSISQNHSVLSGESLRNIY